MRSFGYNWLTRFLLIFVLPGLALSSCEWHETQCLAETESNKADNFLYKDACFKIGLAHNISEQSRDLFILTCMIQLDRKAKCREGINYPEFDYDND